MCDIGKDKQEIKYAGFTKVEVGLGSLQTFVNKGKFSQIEFNQEFSKRRRITS